jgi:pyruvate kinase
MRRTKIVATLGPATEDLETLEGILQAGVDVVRLNFSHGSHDEHRQRARRVREVAGRLGRPVAILADLQGPKIRIRRFRAGPIELQEGAFFALDVDLGNDEGDRTQVGVTYEGLPDDVRIGDMLLLDDGRIVLQTERVIGRRIETRVVIGGLLSNNKGINRQGGGLTAPAITAKDREDIAITSELDADYVAVSFPRDASDMQEARRLLRDAGSDALLVAKIERSEAVEAIDEIVAASDVIMVARGDLAVEIGDAQLPAVQKRIIYQARSLDRIVITATQMMESMIESPIPTRAEVLDVANAVLDGTDAVMLSAETATGHYPVRVVEAMERICIGAEREEPGAKVSDYRINSRFTRVDEAIAIATMFTSKRLSVRAIIALTESGSTPLWMSRISSETPIFALTRHEHTVRRVALYRGVYPIRFHPETYDHAQVNRDAVGELRTRGMVDEGDLVIITKGDLEGVHGGTNAFKIVRLGEMAEPIPNV